MSKEERVIKVGSLLKGKSRAKLLVKVTQTFKDRIQVVILDNHTYKPMPAYKGQQFFMSLDFIKDNYELR